MFVPGPPSQPEMTTILFDGTVLLLLFLFLPFSQLELKSQTKRKPFRNSKLNDLLLFLFFFSIFFSFPIWYAFDWFEIKRGDKSNGCYVTEYKLWNTKDDKSESCATNGTFIFRKRVYIHSISPYSFWCTISNKSNYKLHNIINKSNVIQSNDWGSVCQI